MQSVVGFSPEEAAEVTGLVSLQRDEPDENPASAALQPGAFNAAPTVGIFLGSGLADSIVGCTSGTSGRIEAEAGLSPGESSTKGDKGVMGIEAASAGLLSGVDGSVFGGESAATGTRPLFKLT